MREMRPTAIASTHPGYTLSSTRKDIWENRNYSKVFPSEYLHRAPLATTPCSPMGDIMPLPQMNLQLPEVITLASLKPGALGVCVYNNGTTLLGTVPWNLCNKIYTFCDKKVDFYNCKACQDKNYVSTACSIKWKSDRNCTRINLLKVREFDISSQTRGRQRFTICSTIVPGDRGSRTMANWYFLCGHTAYASLPRNWGGLCALVPLSSPVTFLKKAQDAHSHGHYRTKRDIMPGVQRWGGLTTKTGVPWKFRIWGGGEKFMQSLFPWVGVGEVRDHVEINRYALLRLINNTYQLANGTTKELTALRNMVLQNRIVLDFLTASQGGVCKIIGSACCTFIPDETGTGGAIHDALHELEELQDYVNSATQGSRPFDFFSWFTSGPWWQLLLKIGTPILTVLILFCLFTTCILPCLRSMMLKTFNTALISYQMVRVTSNTDEDYILLQKNEDEMKTTTCDNVL
ncbi:syncytin-A-like isoform X2 [Gambusia affinis]|uniref:syncytin-A-like isoform X2 n=1 Tax=Gambusia affinis TaxID=33528 RepID=UPI001CDC09C2|nr:syncytin-A-like isoform X2 [Gambusia affinis]